MSNKEIMAMPLSPDQQVEARILARLKKEQLINETLFEKLKGKLSKGSISIEDWGIDFELYLAKKPEGDDQ